MNIIYGPVPSWRFGRSLGVDPICSREKICSFDCIYCQLGSSKSTTIDQKEYVHPEDLRVALDGANLDLADVITFSGTGEPTLNSSIGEMIRIAKQYGLPVIVLTNGSLLWMDDVRSSLLSADIVSIKLDAASWHIFKKINNPNSLLRFDKIVDGMRLFRKQYGGKYCIQSMFTGINMHQADGIAAIARSLNPAEVQLCTPVRPSAYQALDPHQMQKIKSFFKGMNVVSYYDSDEPDATPFDKVEAAFRRPN